MQASDTESAQAKTEEEIKDETEEKKTEASFTEEEQTKAVSHVVDDIVNDVITSETAKPSVSAVVLATIDDIIQSEPQSPKPASPEKTLVTIIDVEENTSDVRPAASPSSSSSELQETKDDTGSQTILSHDNETEPPPVLPRSPGSRYKVNGRKAPELSGVTTVVVNGRVVTPEPDTRQGDLDNEKTVDQSSGDSENITMDRTVPAPKRRSIYEKAKDRGVDKVVLRLNREAAGNETVNRHVRTFTFFLFTAAHIFS